MLDNALKILFIQLNISRKHCVEVHAENSCWN